MFERPMNYQDTDIWTAAIEWNDLPHTDSIKFSSESQTFPHLSINLRFKFYNEYIMARVYGYSWYIYA